MKYRAHNAQRDANEPPIVEALKRAGASVVRLDQPLDLLVGYQNLCWLLEVKLPEGPRGGTSHSQLNDKQKRFVAQWRGNSAVVRTPEEALRAIGASGRDCT